jgi:hypothetical protein
MHEVPTMKSSTLPPLRVSGELRRQAEAVLEKGETLSGMVLDAVTRNIDYRRARREFIERGIASGTAAELSGKYITAERVLGKLARRLHKARKQAG